MCDEDEKKKDAGEREPERTQEDPALTRRREIADVLMRILRGKGLA
jgi:hypothetical protein